MQAVARCVQAQRHLVVEQLDLNPVLGARLFEPGPVVGLLQLFDNGLFDDGLTMRHAVQL